MTDALYDSIGIGYSTYRKPDPRIMRRICAALGTCRSILNVGAGTGSYEPTDRFVVAIEPSVEMLNQRQSSAAIAIRGSADRLPIRDSSLEAGLAILTLHHWPDWRKGLRDMLRVSRNRIVILTWDPDHDGFWLVQDYFPQILEIDRPIFPPLALIEGVIGQNEIQTVPIPADCCDGFLGAYWQRPSFYLDVGVRQAISTFSKLNDVSSGLVRLKQDLADGTWYERHGDLLRLSEIDLGYRLIIARSESA